MAVVATLWLAFAGDFAHAGQTIGGPSDPAPPLPPPIAGDNFGYFSVRPDLRKCASPACGGVFVQRVNHLTTRCADGKLRPECYVAGVSLQALNLPADQEDSVQVRVKNGTVLLKGQLIVKPFSPLNTPGLFDATEVWLAATDVRPTGTFFRAVDTGIVCAAAPCLSFQEFKLNAYGQTEIAGVDLSLVGANDELLGLAHEALRTEEGILVAGKHKVVSGPAGEASALVASQFYLPVDSGKPEK
ncbi:DUF6748 domain-containing protein [Methylococcus mesophilus]|uniref:DUF6748 domain-containing protein n=1 Tax=Methylococcus mesophilus TaxID=2993564 RepID=UPI00224B0EA2|nr:DUF6748 domain-containing protein [Methylococcus mesophilus]UZR27230.1 hypothetical protein OOT43_10830 [Methylococcus mesophilus]